MRRIIPMVILAAMLLLAATAGADGERTPSEPGAVIDWIFFNPGETAIKPEFDDLLEELAGKIDAAAEGRVEVRGYTDTAEVGGDGHPLAGRRIDAVIERLRALGVGQRALERSPRGTADPWGDNGNEEGRALNRRVDLVRYLPAPPGETGQAPRPVLEIPVTDYRFPPAVEGARVVHDFTVRNTGRADLRIERVRTG